MYLDIQKGIIIEDLPEEEVKGRWKSFVNKWYVCFLFPLYASGHWGTSYLAWVMT